MSTLNRRSFLQALIAVGAHWVLDADASDVEIDAVWQQAQCSPWFFEVDGGNTIVDPDVLEPQVWGDVFDISVSFLKSPQDIVDEVNRCEPLRSHFQDLPRDALDVVLEKLEEEDLSRAERKRLRRLAEAMEDPDDGWEDCVIFEGAKGVEWFQSEIEDWLTEPINWLQYDGETIRVGGQGQAYQFFSSLEHDTLKALGVVLVETEHPGSTYWAAELRVSLESANASAEALQLPIRFRQAQSA